MSAPVPKKLLTMAGIEDCYTSATGQTATLGNFGEYPVFCPGFQKGRVPSEKGTFSAVNGPSKGHN